MTPVEITRRLIHSRRVLNGWRIIPPMGRLEDTMAIINTEIGILGEWAVEYPAKAETIAALIAKWRELGERVKARMH